MVSAIRKAVSLTLDAATLIAVVLGAALALGVHRSDSDLAGAVFTANATFVALILPAAGLANAMLQDRLVSYSEQLAGLSKNPLEAATTAEALSSLAGRMVDGIKPVARGFSFLLIGFFLSIGALFHSNHHIWAGPGWWKVNLEDILLGCSLGFDVLAALLFLPFVWLLVDFDLASKTKALIDAFAESAASEKKEGG